MEYVTVQIVDPVALSVYYKINGYSCREHVRRYIRMMMENKCSIISSFDAWGQFSVYSAEEMKRWFLK